MGNDDFFLLRVVGGTVAAALAIASTAVDGLTTSSLVLFGVATLAFAFPWQRLSTLKAGPLEFSLEQEQVRGALDGIKVDGPEKDRIERALSRLGPDLEQARGSRVLWVDDKPPRLLGERRLLRSLGIETVIAPTCRGAAMELLRDNDFDLLITSVVKSYENKSIRDPTNPTVLLIRWLRGRSSSGTEELLGVVPTPVKDPVINALRVIVYAALPVPSIWGFLQPVAALRPTVDACEQLDDLLTKTITTLAELRANPLRVGIGKEAHVLPNASLHDDPLS